MTEWKRDGNLLYTLTSDGFSKGVEQFRNRLMVRFEADHRDKVPQEEIDAAIALFLAAPELLAALKSVNDRLDYLRNLWGDEGLTRTLCDKLKAVIAKAEGGAK